MKKIPLFCLAALLAMRPATGTAEGSGPFAEPNIIIILADDLGYGDLQCYNPQGGKIVTPHTNRLAAEGMRFTDAHSSSAVCSPSRYTLLTGRYHWRTRLQSGVINEFGQSLIAPDRLTVAGLLQQHGYRTACMGKWHLGWKWPIPPAQMAAFRLPAKPARDTAPTEQQRALWREVFSKPLGAGPTTCGFDTYFGTDIPNWPPYCFIENDRTVGIPSEFLGPRQLLQGGTPGPALKDWTFEPILPTVANRASQFIAESAETDNPFFLLLSLTSPHTPLAVNEKWRGKSGLGPYADFVGETDAVVGQILQTLDQSGASENTLVLFTSDNGCASYIGAEGLKKKGHSVNGPLRGYKYEAWEGGHRVPFIVRWPRIVKPRSVCDQLVLQADLMATCAAILGTRLPEEAGEDSVDLLPLLKGEDRPIRESGVQQSSQGLLAIRKGPWKFIAGPGSGGHTPGRDRHPAQLYSLDEDLGETNNLYPEHPEIAAELLAFLEKTVVDGRSTPGAKQANDVPVNWRRFLAPEARRSE